MSGTETSRHRLGVLAGRQLRSGIALPLVLVGIAVAVLAATPLILTSWRTAGPGLPGPSVERVRADDHCGRLLDAIVAADMGGDGEARRAARSTLRASSCRLGRSVEPR